MTNSNTMIGIPSGKVTAMNEMAGGNNGLHPDLQQRLDRICHDFIESRAGTL